MKARFLRRLVFAALVGVFLALLGLLGANLYLNGEYLPRLVRQELSGLTVRYSFAWTLWPGRVHLENLRLGGEEHGFAWELRADRAQLRADVPALAERRLHLERLSLAGVSVRLRPHVHYLDANPEYLAQLPQVEAELRLKEEGPLLPPGLRPVHTSWPISAQVLELDRLQEVHIDRFLLRGRLDVVGSLQLGADRVLRLGESKVAISRAGLQIDGEQVLEDLSGHATFALGPVLLGEQGGAALLGTLSGDAELSADVVGLGFLPRLPGLPVPVELEVVKGPIHTSARMKDGAVLPGAVLEWTAGEVQARASGFHFAGQMTLLATVVEEEGKARTRAQVTFADYRMGRSLGSPLATARRLQLSLQAPNLSLARAASFSLDLQEALSLWPGRLELEGLRLAGVERALQWEASLEQLSSAVDLSALAKRELLLSRARGRTARVLIRPRQGAIFPPAPPLALRKEQNPWGIRSEDAKVEDVREILLEAYRFEGQASAAGSFLYEPGGRLSAGPLELEIKEGVFHVSRWRAAKALVGRVEAQLAPFDLQEAEGYEVFRHLTSRAELQAQLDEVDFIRHYPAVPMPAELGGGQGPLRAKVSMREGVVQAGSEVHWETRAVQASTHGHRVVGPLTLQARWNDSGGEASLRLEAKVSPYRLTKVGEDRALVGGKLATLRIDAKGFDLGRPSFEPVTQVQVVDGAVPDLRVLNEYLPKDLALKMEAGTGTFTGKVAFAHRGAAWAELQVGGKDAALVYDKVQVKGNWSCEAKLGNVDLETGAAEISSATLKLDNMAMREGSRANQGWFGRVDVTRGVVRPGKAVLLEGELETTMRDGRPLVSFFAAETELMPAWARSLVTLQALRATARFRLGEDMVELDGLNARGQSLEIRGRLRKQGTRQWGDMLVLSRGQEVGLALRGNRVEFKLLGASTWYRGQMLDPRW